MADKPFTRAPYTDEHLNAFVAGAQKVIDDYYAGHFSGTTPERLEVQRGVKWDRIVHDGAAWAFIQKGTGIICKPESWKRPAKGERGTIHTPRHGVEFVTWEGPRYLRDMKKDAAGG